MTSITAQTHATLDGVIVDDPGHLVRLRLSDSTTLKTGAVRLFLEPVRV
jgi:hypothetical protein